MHAVSARQSAWRQQARARQIGYSQQIKKKPATIPKFILRAILRPCVRNPAGTLRAPCGPSLFDHESDLKSFCAVSCVFPFLFACTGCFATLHTQRLMPDCAGIVCFRCLQKPGREKTLKRLKNKPAPRATLMQKWTLCLDLATQSCLTDRVDQPTLPAKPEIPRHEAQ